MSHLIRVRRATSLAVGVGLTVFVAVALAFGVSANASAGASRPGSKVLFNSQRTARILVKRFRILRTAHSATASTLPPALDGFVNRRVGVMYGLNTGAVTEAQPAAGITMWLVPGDSGACDFAEITTSAGVRFVGSCGPVTNQKLGYGLVTGDASDQLALGFAPDGNSSMTADLTGGKQVQAPVVDNAYVINVPSGSQVTDLRGIDLAGNAITVAAGIRR